MMARPYCCVCAEFDGIAAEDHARVCREPREEPQTDGALFDLPDQPTTRGPQL